MAVVTIHLLSSLPPAEALRVLTDFSPQRSAVWPGIDDEHFTVHEVGDGWADITEGNATTWERERYSWQPGLVTATTTDSNVWATGSGWEYRLVPEGNGTAIDVKLTRHGRDLKGMLIAALLPFIGRSVVTKSLVGPLQAQPRRA